MTSQASAPSGFQMPATSSGLVPTTSTMGAAGTGSTSAPKLDYRQLEDQINKWTNELDEQESLFINQALKINYWDRTLMINGEKITKLASDMIRVKSDHKRVESGIEDLRQSQRTFESFLESVEPHVPTNYTVIPERANMYSKIENVDTQLQQMGEDLREVVRSINDSNKVLDKSNHVGQVLKILNEHTDAMHWIGKTMEEVKENLEEVAKAHQALKDSHDQSIRALFQR